MAERYLLTHSLLSSWLYSMKENPYEDATSDKDSYQEFLMSLNRERTPTTDAMQNGIDFEDLVTAIAQGRGNQKDKWYDVAQKIAHVVAGAPLQYRAKKEITVNGITVLLYGRLDALKAGTIYDIKFSKSYDVGKYLTSTQHPTYFELVPEADTFSYLVSNGSSVWTESYRRDETQSIIPIISDFFQFLEANGLMEIYKVKWLAA